MENHLSSEVNRWWCRWWWRWLIFIERIFCNSHCCKNFPITLLITTGNLWVLPVSEMGKLSHRGFERLAQGHRTRKWQDLNPGNPILEVSLLTTPCASSFCFISNLILYVSLFFLSLELTNGLSLCDFIPSTEGMTRGCLAPLPPCCLSYACA